MVESVKVKAERSVFSIKKETILSALIPRLKLPRKPLFANIDEQIVERNKKWAQKKGDRLLFLYELSAGGDSLLSSRKSSLSPFFKIRRFS